MKKYTLAEKKFITENRPQITIESVKFSPLYERYGEESPAEEICHFAEGMDEVFVNEEQPVEGVYAVFQFRDTGADFKQKYIRFGGFAQLMDDESEEELNFVSNGCSFVFPETAKDGTFKVCVPFILRKDEEREEMLYERLAKDSAVFQFTDVMIGNGFVNENIGVVMGNMRPDGEPVTDLELEAISYSLAGEEEQEESGEETANDVDLI